MVEIPWIPSVFVMVIVVIAFCFQKSLRFRYIFKFCFYGIYASAAALLTIPFLIFRPNNVDNLKMTIPTILLRPLPKLLGIKWVVHGASVFDRDFPCVVVSNHQSGLDMLAMFEVWPLIRRCAAIVKKELLYVFPFGFGAWLCGTIFVDRANAKDAKVKMSKTGEWIRENNTKLWIFPEGTRHKGPSLKPFKKGAFHIAVQNKLPIVPVVISPYTFIDDEKFIFDSGKVYVSIMSPIPTTDVPDVNELIKTTHDRMSTEFQRLSKTVHSYSENVSTRSENGQRSTQS